MLKHFLSIILMISLATVVYAKRLSKNEIIHIIKQGAPATKELLKKVPIDYYQNNYTLLHYAVQFRKRDVVQLLVKEKIDLSRKGGRFHGTALQDAIHYGYLGIASYLLKKGTLVNIQNKYGETALHIAAKNGYLEMVEQLLAHGASKNIANKNGERAYDLIPNLSWDSRKKMKRVLEVRESEQPNVHSKSIDIINQNIHAVGNNNMNIIDKKTKIDKNSNMGLDIDIHKINKF